MVVALLTALLLLVAGGANATERVPYTQVFKQATDRESQLQGDIPILSWHRFIDCPYDSEENFFPMASNPCIEESNGDGSVKITCSDFVQKCQDQTVRIDCQNYQRSCEYNPNSDNVTCTEEYDICNITKITPDYDSWNASFNATGTAPELMAECIPAVNALRDGCNATMERCNTTFTFRGENDLLECRIECEDLEMECRNYTRSCTQEYSSVRSVNKDEQVWIGEGTNCTVVTLEREKGLEMFHNYTKKNDMTGLLGEADLREIITFNNYSESVGWETCKEETKVDYKPICNQYIKRMLKRLEGAVFEPNAHSFDIGIQLFLSEWEEGWKELCTEHCFLHLIKFSRQCWHQVPMQRFMPNADYRTIELFMRNLTRIACYEIGPSNVDYSSDEEFIKSRKSCAVFFDPNHNLTRRFYKNITAYCREEEPDMCSNVQCVGALDALADRLGCCLGSIEYAYDKYSGWLRLFNFANHPILRRMEACKTVTTPRNRCEELFVTSISVTIVRNFIYVISGIMAAVVVLMMISFYWQLEHEPIKKAFYHF